MGIVMDSRHAMLTLPQEKLNSIIDQRQLLLSREEVTVPDISQLIGKLSYPAEAVLPVSLHYRSLERQKIWSFQCRKTLREEFVYLKRPRKNLFGE